MVRSMHVFLFVLGVAHAAPEEVTIAETFVVSAATVEVVVTNKAGERVADLPKQAFQLSVNGQPQPLTYFSEVRTLVENNPAAIEALPPHVFATTMVPRNYLLFIDDWFTHRAYRAKVFKNLIANVDAMRVIDQMAVVRYKGKGLELLTPWTNDQDELREILREAYKSKPGEMLRLARLESRGGHLQEVELERQIADTVTAVEITMRSLSPPNGRNMLLLMSQGWPYRFRKSFAVREKNEPKQGGAWLLRPITDTANLLGYTVYPFLIGTLDPGDLGGRETPSFANFSHDTQFEVLHDGLSFLAERTGGSLVNKSQFNKTPLGSVADDQQGYYTLGFSTGNLPVGNRHDIKIELIGYDYEVRYRQDFRTRTPEEQADVMARAALFTGESPDNLEVSLGTPQKAKGRQLTVPFTITIPMDWVNLEQKGDTYFAKMTLRVSAADKGGYQADVANAPIELSGGRPGPGTTSTYDAAILIRRGKQRLVFTLEDTIGGGVLTRIIDFKP